MVKNKIFIFEGYNRDYSDGLAIVTAPNEDMAIGRLMKECSWASWDGIKEHKISEDIVYEVSGGG
jgi:hypothetical protein